ncbi:hypothetical protein Esi_0181_0053 [Ectocarpus siliculosus]|uniref:Uncharacterized protein n=1 Tax=Ectocarpus siliculosus TaxID=2880 RepID=D8LGV8_ECTSI|nr:hypothetical protein Esi_0181_0053 [Ectocarpus siliculosus]|eukprot:CBN75811.1 hypothetical protein Esi_0181_0053 [Ectocarpus siliculosus]
MTSLPKRIRPVPLPEAVPATPVPRTRCHAMHGNNYAAHDDDRAGGRADIHNLDAPGQQERHHFGGAPAGIGDDVAASRDIFGEQGGGFGWLREFGNGKTDIAGLVLSTVLLMTAVGAPLGAAADLGVVDGRVLDPSSLSHGPTAVRLNVENAVPVPTAEKARANRVGALNLGGLPPRRPPVTRVAGVESEVGAVGEASTRRTGPLAKMAGDSMSAVRDIAHRAGAIAASRGPGRESAPGAPGPLRTAKPDVHKEPPPEKTEDSGSVVGDDHPHTSLQRGVPSAGRSTTVNAVRSGGQVEDGTGAAAKAARSDQLEELENEHTKLFGDSLPLSTLPDSFNRAIRRALPSVLPPAMAVFLTVSMPAVILLLKGVGTTLVAVAKGYGKADRRRSDDGHDVGSALEVGFGGGGGVFGGSVGGEGKRRERGPETPGSAFQMFLGGNGGSGGVDAGGSGHGGDVDTRAGGPMGDSSGGVAPFAPPLTVQQVSTERQGFFSKPRQQHPQLKDTGGGFAVGDDAMAAMAMAAMTQELTVMKHSLQKEVESMRNELERASDDSRRLTDKLCRLEEDNRRLEAVVSRLGGQDARRLKAQLFSLLASPSMGQLGQGNPSTQLSPA